MKIIIGDNKKIESGGEGLKPGSNILGEVEGVVNPETLELQPVKDRESLDKNVMPSQIYARGGIVNLDEQNNFSWAAPDFSAFHDIFYIKLPDKKLLLGDNFFDVLSHLKSVTIKKSDIEFFIKFGYFLPGKSFFEEMSRVKIGNKLEVHNNVPVEKSIWDLPGKLPKIDYDTFKKAISSVISCCNVSDDDAIFLSSGCDSGLVAAIISKKFGKHPLATTFRHTQVLRLNAIDNALIKNITEFLGMENLVLDVDRDKEDIHFLDLFVERTPQGAYQPLPYYVMAKEIQKRNIKKLWAGENADYLYGGLSSTRFSGTLKRFYHSKGYIRSLPDIKDKTPLAPLYRSVGWLGNLIFLANGFDTRQPKDFQELANAIENSTGFMALPKRGSSFGRKHFQAPMTSFQARQYLMERIVQYNLAGRDGRAIYDVASECQIKPFLPYAATNMIHFFRNLEKDHNDLFQPKRFIYRYLEELVGDKDYERLYSSPRKDFLDKSKSYINFEQWQKGIANETHFGRAQRKAVEDMIHTNPILNEFKHLFDFNTTYCLNHMFWLGRIIERTKNMGIEIKYHE